MTPTLPWVFPSAAASDPSWGQDSRQIHSVGDQAAFVGTPALFLTEICMKGIKMHDLGQIYTPMSVYCKFSFIHHTSYVCDSKTKGLFIKVVLYS